jgi:thioredoxin-dependent peroxiredoxin
MSKKYALYFLIFIYSSLNALQIGQTAPDFQLPDETGTKRTLADYKDKRVVLFFYPKDNSPFCTTQIMALKSGYSLLEKNNIIAFGINYDTPESHNKLKTKYNLPFSLLTDKTGDVAKAYDANRHKLLDLFPKQVTILIENNKIKAIIDKVKTKTYVVDLLKAFNK